MKKLILELIKEKFFTHNSNVHKQVKNYSTRLVSLSKTGTTKVCNIFKKVTLNDFSWKSPKVIAGAIAVVLVAGSGITYLNGTTSAAYILINGQQVGLVSSLEDGQKLVDGILKKRGQPVGQKAMTHDKIDYQSVRVKKAALLDKVSENDLESKLTSYIEGYELKISGTQVAVLPSKEELEKVLNTYKDFYAQPSESNKVSSIEFEEPVTMTPVELQPDKVKLSEQVLQILKDGQTTTKEYEVQPNDSWWLIARKNDMKTKEVLAGNPGMNEDTRLQIGQKIKLVSVTPYLTVISKGVYTGTETIPFDVTTKTDFGLASGTTVVKQEGSDGLKEVTYSYTKKNGKNIEKTVLDEKITKKPVNQVVAKGPSRAPVTVGYVSRGSGNVSGIGWPLRGRINSYYGYRWGGFHTGIDIDGDRGDPYVAGASGTVVSAGWDGGYGNAILIDHGNGVMTRYAHSTKLLVSAGQQVSKGQTIGLVGSTGRSTGPHLHFEIIVNGDTVNPLNYLP
ncbi:MAG: peptidoglycan DD-metalloendopeptidase family protein [Desulfitobacterium hafniense]|nr:peptidoglycan DD-metalloendopeptidase family protein [Desulfitobacterium hafniense]